MRSRDISTQGDGQDTPEDARGPVDLSALGSEPQVRHPTTHGKRRCIRAPLDGAGNPLVLASLDLQARGSSTCSDVDIYRLRRIIDAQGESQSKDANTTAHWQQLQEDEEARPSALHSGSNSDGSGWVLVQGRARKGKGKPLLRRHNV